MQISPISNKITQHWKRPVRDTGYVATGCAVASLVCAKTKQIKAHKQLAYASGIFTIMHIGILELMKHSKT